MEGWRLLRASDLLKVLNKVAGRVSDVRPFFCETKVQLGQVGVLYQGKGADTSVR